MKILKLFFCIMVYSFSCICSASSDLNCSSNHPFEIAIIGDSHAGNFFFNNGGFVSSTNSLFESTTNINESYSIGPGAMVWELTELMGDNRDRSVIAQKGMSLDSFQTNYSLDADNLDLSKSYDLSFIFIGYMSFKHNYYNNILNRILSDYETFQLKSNREKLYAYLLNEYIVFVEHFKSIQAKCLGFSKKCVFVGVQPLNVFDYFVVNLNKLHFDTDYIMILYGELVEFTKQYNSEIISRAVGEDNFYNIIGLLEKSDYKNTVVKDGSKHIFKSDEDLINFLLEEMVMMEKTSVGFSYYMKDPHLSYEGLKLLENDLYNKYVLPHLAVHTKSTGDRAKSMCNLDDY